MKVETVEIFLLADIINRLKQQKEENVLIFVDSEFYEDIKRIALKVFEPSYVFDGKIWHNVVQHVQYDKTVELWFTRLTAHKYLSWYCVIAMRENGEKIKYFKGEEGSDMLIFNLK